MPRRMAIATMGLLPCLSLAGQSDAGDIARRIIRADGLPCAFLGPAPLPLTRGAGAPRARRDKSRLPRSMREAVSSGSATGHGDGPEPLWPRLASGDLRPAPAGMKRRSCSDPQPPLRCHPARAGMNPSRIAARTFAPRSRWLAPRSAHQMMAGAAPGTSTRPTALDLEGHRAQPPDTPPEGSAPLRTGTQTQGPRNRDTMVEPSQGSACLAERERSFRCRTRRHTGLNPRSPDR